MDTWCRIPHSTLFFISEGEKTNDSNYFRKLFGTDSKIKIKSHMQDKAK